MKYLNPFGDVNRDCVSLLPLHQLGTLPIQQRVLQAPVPHVLVHEQQPAAAAAATLTTVVVVGEAEDGDHEVCARGFELGEDGELVVELSLALERSVGIHELDGDVLAGFESSLEDRAEAALADPVGGGEGGGGEAEGGVGEAVWGGGFE